jgi:exonuclease III
MDYLFVVDSLLAAMDRCETGDPARVFDTRMSDHLPIVADFLDQ